MSEAAQIVYLVDDDTSVLKALSRLLESAGLTTVAFDSPEKFLEAFNPVVAGCLVLDVTMPGLNGLELQQALAAEGSLLPIIFLTGNGDVPTSVQAMKRGAADFLTKPVNDDDLLSAIRSAFNKNSESIRNRKEVVDFEQRVESLTPRERQVFSRVVLGVLNKQIAWELDIAEKTIKVHRGHVMEKMGARSAAELAGLAARAGMGIGKR